MLTCLTVALLPMAACSAELPVSPSAEDGGGPVMAVDSHAVTDLRATGRTTSTITLGWTEVDDGRGSPAEYRVKYAAPPISWSSATTGCSRVIGVRIGSPISCTVEDLPAAKDFDFELMSYRLRDGVWVGAVHSNVARGTTAAMRVGTVTDLLVMRSTQSTLTLHWTQVQDGGGQPASYRLKYAAPPIDWSTASIGCAPTMVGTEVGAPMSCTVTGLKPGNTYDVEVMSFRSVKGVWQDGQHSNIARGATSPPSSTWQAAGRGIWISHSELAALPTSGAAWASVLEEANTSCGIVDLSDQNQRNNVCVLAKALAYARTETSSYRTGVAEAIRQIASTSTYTGEALSLGRELAAYVIAADLIGLPAHDAALDAAFRLRLRALLTTPTTGAASNLVDCHERRPNNWGTMCGATRAAIAVYLADDAELARTAQVFKGYLGDRASYAGFSYGELSWQCDPNRPVGVNRAGCTRDGHDLDGVLPDDQRRGGSYAWPPVKENYAWEALQGAVVQAVILTRAGFPAFEWEDRAIYRAVRWLHRANSYPAAGDDTWLPHIVNRVYGSSFAAPVPSRPGKIMGWADWTHRP
jgi:hypothetical protein